MKKVCMVVQDPMVKGGVAAVVNGYRGSRLKKDYKIIYVESYKDGGKLTKLLKGISGYINFIKVLLIDKPDLVHIHSSFGPSFYRKLPFIYMASWAKLPIVNHIHGADFDEFYTRANPKKKNTIKKAYGKCSKLIALSQEWMERLSQIVPREKIEIVENYSIIHEDAYLQRKVRTSNNQVLFLGELGKRKGCFDIPAVAEKVVRVIPNVLFILCGAGKDEDEKTLKSLFTEKNIEKNVLFPGWVRDKKKDKALREADVFFLPSYNEGMPMSVLDAMGYGLPIVSTNVGGIPRIVHNGENGTCCNAGDIEMLANGIIRLLTDDKLRLNAATETMRIVKNGYSLENHLERIECIYKNQMRG